MTPTTGPSISGHDPPFLHLASCRPAASQPALNDTRLRIPSSPLDHLHGGITTAQPTPPAQACQWLRQLDPSQRGKGTISIDQLPGMSSSARTT